MSEISDIRAIHESSTAEGDSRDDCLVKISQKSSLINWRKSRKDVVWQQICALLAGSTLSLGKFKATGFGVICLTVIAVIYLLNL